MSDGAKGRSGTKAGSLEADTLSLISEALGRHRFGEIQLTVHEGRLVQMEVTEKRRFV